MTTHGYSEDELVRRLYNDAIDSLDEELELELETGKTPTSRRASAISRSCFGCRASW